MWPSFCTWQNSIYIFVHVQYIQLEIQLYTKLDTKLWRYSYWLGCWLCFEEHKFSAIYILQFIFMCTGLPITCKYMYIYIYHVYLICRDINSREFQNFCSSMLAFKKFFFYFNFLLKYVKKFTEFPQIILRLYPWTFINYNTILHWNSVNTH